MSTDRFQAISEHLRLHIEEGHLEDGICEHELCHANMYSLTAEVKELFSCDSTVTDNK